MAGAGLCYALDRIRRRRSLVARTQSQKTGRYVSQDMKTMRKLTVLIGVLLALPGGMALAEKLYKWVDGQGNVSYHDRRPPADSGYRVQEKNVGGKGVRASDAGDEKPTVVLYTITKCASCDAARAHL